MWIADQIGCVDRLDDYSHLCSAMTKVRGTASGFALYGRSGIGKTYISGLLAEKCYKHLDVQIPYSATDSAVKDGFAQRTIGGLIHSLANKDEHSFEPFEKWLLKYPDQSLLERLLKDVYQDIKDKHLRKIPGAKFVIEHLTSTGDMSAADIFASKVEAGVSLASQYVITSLANAPFFCRVQNAQKIDEVSCSFLAELVRLSPDSKIVFEFTCEEVDGKMQQVIDMFSYQDIHIKPYPVGVIGFEEFESGLLGLKTNDGFGTIDEIVIKSARERYEETSGNVLDMFYHIDTLLAGVGKVDGLGLKGTRAKLSQTRDVERVVISILALHGGSIDKGRLKYLLQRQALFDTNSLKRSVAELIEKRLLNKQDESFSLFHDDVSHQILTWGEYSRAVLLVARDMVSFFEELLSRASTSSMYMEFVGRLIHLNAVTGDAEALRSLLAELERRSASFHSPEEARRSLHPIWDIVKNTNKDEYPHLKAAYCAAAYNSRLYQETQDILSTLPQDELDVQLMQAAVLNRMDEHDRAIEACSNILSNPNIPASKKVQARIVAIYAFRSKCDFESCYQMFLDGEKDLEGTAKDQALFLRSAEVILRADLSLEYLRKAKKQFKESGDDILQAYACIDLGMQLGRLGKAKEARNELRKADDLLAANPKQRFAVTNNLAVINMNEEKFDDETVSLLLYTRNTTTIAFDRLAAEMNLLIAYTMRNERKLVKQVSKKLIKGVQQWEKRDQGLLELIGYNLAWATKTIGGDSQLVKRLKQYQKQYLSANHWTWKEHKFGPLPDEYVLPGKPYRVCWLSPWHFPMSITLRNQ